MSLVFYRTVLLHGIVHVYNYNHTKELRVFEALAAVIKKRYANNESYMTIRD
jgi:ssRNA-specific RNase YbeY (16S rRNA maturation enzyme)